VSALLARAPGKLVLSGAYAVLEGAPSIVTAVSRNVEADAARPAPLLTEEVRAAIDLGALAAAPWFDADALRERLPDGSSRKLGLGSSAAILVASLAATYAARRIGAAPPETTRPGAARPDPARPDPARPDPTRPDPARPDAPAVSDLRALREAIFPVALAAHRRAQPQGSGVDVAASTFGGVLRASLRGTDRALDLAAHPLPPGSIVEVFASPIAASTARFLEAVRALETHAPARYRRLLDEAARGAHQAIEAQSPGALCLALDAQWDALDALGEAAAIPIVTPEVRALRPQARDQGGAFGPSGAGGGDIALHIGAAPSSPGFRARARALGLTLLDLSIGAEGVHFAPRDP
jgi:phosphomevalonate kinase